jgi:hypothetical protein
MSILVLVVDDEPDVEMLRTDVRSGSRLCENSDVGLARRTFVSIGWNKKRTAL